MHVLYKGKSRSSATNSRTSLLHHDIQTTRHILNQQTAEDLGVSDSPVAFKHSLGFGNQKKSKCARHQVSRYKLRAKAGFNSCSCVNPSIHVLEAS